ncbi:MAG: hypothetical protein WD529_02030 [Balneolaceae bacterium]
MNNSKCVQTLLYLFMVGSVAWGCAPASGLAEEDRGTGTEAPSVALVLDADAASPAMHGMDAVASALQEQGVRYERVSSPEDTDASLLLVAGVAGGNGAAAQRLNAFGRELPEAAESLTLWSEEGNGRTVWTAAGRDSRGVMYALYDVADRIGWAEGADPFAELNEITEQPEQNERAMSIYTFNRAYWEKRFYDEEYWERYLDQMARNRFNSLVLIFGYENGGFLAPPYPYFFDVDGYPDVEMVGITPEEQRKNLAALQRLIDMAGERGIDFTVGIWDHIYRGGVQTGTAYDFWEPAPQEPRHGLVWGLNAENLIPYTKAGMAQFVQTLEGLNGVQLRIHWESGISQEEQLNFWPEIFATMREIDPDLRLDLRAKELTDEIIQFAIDSGVKFRVTTKHWMEHMGMPNHPTETRAEGQVRRHSYANMLRYPKEYEMHWRLWNGATARVLLWGDPEFGRRFVESTHLYDGDGFEINEPLLTRMLGQPHQAEFDLDLLGEPYRYYDYEFERYWHLYHVFGRIGYNPDTDPAVWEREFERRLGREAGPLLMEALHTASWILPRIVASNHPRRAFFPMTYGWPEKQRLNDLPTYAMNQAADPAQYANMDQEARMMIEGGETALMLPSRNSKWFQQTSQTIDRLVAEAIDLAGPEPGPEFHSTVTDLKILSALSLYHSRRIPAGISYRLFQRTDNPAALDEAITRERHAIAAWRKLVKAAGDVYADDLKMGMWSQGLSGHWRDELQALEEGLAALEAERVQYRAEFDPDEPTHAPLFRSYPGDYFDYDELFQVQHEPVVSHPAGTPLTIEIQVDAPAGVRWVHLRHRLVNEELRFSTIPMERVAGEENLWRATVPVEEMDPLFNHMYFIEMMDEDGNGRIWPDGDRTAPHIYVRLQR